VYPLACPRHNFDLGGNLEAKTPKDYWVNFAIRKLGLKHFKVDPSFTPDSRQNRYTLRTDANGTPDVVPPPTDPVAYRIIAKIAFESAALFIGNEVFLPTFDEYRGFILTGSPDLVNKRIVRCCYDLSWGPGHVIEFLPSKGEQPFAVQVRLFNAYVFTAVFMQPVGGPNISPASQVVMDLDTGKMVFRKLSGDGKRWECIAGY